MKRNLVKISDLSTHAVVGNSSATVVIKGDEIYADVVFRESLYFLRVAHRDGRSPRLFSSINTAVRILSQAGFAEVSVKFVDQHPEWIHTDDEEILIWEQEFERLGIDAPIENLRDHLANAPEVAPSRAFLEAFIDGYNRGEAQLNK